MSRAWQRLISCVSVVALLLANTHAGTAVSAFLREAPSQPRADGGTDRPGKSAPEGTESRPSSGCKHCTNRARAAAAVSRSERAGKNASTWSGPASHNDGVEEPCPCCPKGPSCPIPGGCAMCSVAKTLCTNLLPVLPRPDAIVGNCVTDYPVLYLPPSGEGMTRPPRA